MPHWPRAHEPRSAQRDAEARACDERDADAEHREVTAGAYMRLLSTSAA